MSTEAPVTAIAHLIQLAVAPVFLLMGVAGLLGVLTNRLSRIVDRGRVLEVRLSTTAPEQTQELQDELVTLCRRSRLVSRAITLSVTCALLVCTVIVVLFLQAFLATNIRGVIALLFIAAMLVLIAALLTFLREIYLATASLRISSYGAGSEPRGRWGWRRCGP